MILEGIVTTTGPDGRAHLAPMGPEFGADPARFELRPFRTSTTFRNLDARGEGVWHAIDDPVLLASTAIGRPVDPPTRPARSIRGFVLPGCCRYLEFRVVERDASGERARFVVEATAEGRGDRDWPGWNRARSAVVEAAILATRAHILPAESIAAEFDRLATIVGKTGAEEDRVAFSILVDHLRAPAAGGPRP